MIPILMGNAGGCHKPWQEHLLYLADSDKARCFLSAKWPRYEALPLEYTEAELARLMDDWQEVAAPPDWAERLAESVRESLANYRLLMQWLDQQRAGKR